mmetsp:Transcript_12187/g.48973  ORF Transcript_12187/g.48973 Transcript_12187/m.48973 type:complete len:101 (-) Transcript_12187:46-348(-)
MLNYITDKVRQSFYGETAEERRSMYQDQQECDTCRRTSGGVLVAFGIYSMLSAMTDNKKVKSRPFFFGVGVAVFSFGLYHGYPWVTRPENRPQPPAEAAE